ncbi:MAG: hypothetical protein HZA61_06290 [Candidatus Eisenbacteria bacterium]|uniref:TIGR03016 family PEP-CTERM system-associated outer membrane protein n=1 Tax=Eiseniibacteriota bacterium TaxID=2212470 RepID=A0A933W830_UNCEI|nr:hypothetical protein [Candidatus Eisenbacteria bacterium]
MRDDRPHRRRLAALLLGGLLLAPGFARAQSLYGTVQLQYQNAEDDVIRVAGDGSRFAERVRRETWLRTVDLHHQSYLRTDWLLDSNLRLSGASVLGTGSGTSTPQGTMRLMHPYLQVSASHAPTSTRTTVAARTGVTADSSAQQQRVVARTAETALTGHMAVPRLPQLDVSWIRNRREGVAAAAGEASVARNARMSFDRDHYSLYGAFGDTRQQSDVAASPANSQRLLNAGGSYRLMPVANSSLAFQYDFGSVRGEIGGAKRSSTSNHSASVTGDWRPKPWLTPSLNYQWRRSRPAATVLPAQTDQEGAMLVRVAAQRGASLSAGGGIRTQRLFDRQELLKYATAMASADGELRHGLAVNSSASHTTSWDPSRGTYGSEAIASALRASFGRSAEWDASWQLSANGDTGSVLQRYSNTWSSRLQAMPLRNLTVAVSLRSLRVGPGLLKPSGTSRGAGLDVQWRPFPACDLLGSYATTGVFPNEQQRSSTRSLTAKLESSSKLQLYGTYTRTDQTGTVIATTASTSHESASGRVQWQPTRRVAASGTLTVSEPGREQEARQVDVAFTWSFGR